MHRSAPLLNCLLLLLIPILVALPLSQLLGRPLAHYLLEQKMEDIQQALLTRQIELNTALREQLPKLTFDCGKGDMALLREPRFYNSHFRLLGIELASGGGCSSLGPAIPAAAIAFPTTAEDRHYGLTATAAGFHTEQELVAYFQVGGNTIYWVLNNSWVHHQLKDACANCFFIEFIPKDPQLHTPYLTRGDRNIKHELSHQSLSLTFEHPGSEFKQTLWGGIALQRHAEQQAHKYAVYAGSALGLVMLTGYLLRRHYRRSLKGLLQTGIAQQEFTPFYQPIIDSRDQRVVGFEALLRWQCMGNHVPPAVFIRYSEEQGLILPITEQVLEQVIIDLQKLPSTLWVSVNIVAAHIEQPLLRHLLQKHHWPSPERLNFELTERSPITKIDTAMREITALQQQGYHFKLDDFGTGYGGFSYLQRLGIRQIKIDKMFVDTVGTDDLKRTVLDAIIASGRESGMEMIAEGVETQEQVKYLNQNGVYLLQGYVYAKPMPLSQALHWLKQQGS
ncbi:EAL domain-containing protein [Aeromonas cavernicola]|uniref:Diguanylate phosphodiesterase n=1 Tax=Aeromonas cavernicola TaxID=1006623 RepID=A0A2H9U7J7_9GAMM|nr:EAL domain-containing protein [Aeromonas cavernicola]PJG60010.1 diguanylate phosphodiesterase [Aeromonas cavernicola]